MRVTETTRRRGKWMVLLFFMIGGLSLSMSACGRNDGPAKEKETSSAGERQRT